ADDGAIRKADDPRSVLGDLRLVGDEDDCNPSLGIQPLEDLHDLDARPAVEIAGRLIREQDRRIVEQRARDRDALLLSAGELIGMVAGTIREPDGPTTATNSPRAIARVTPRRACTGAPSMA